MLAASGEQEIVQRAPRANLRRARRALRRRISRGRTSGSGSTGWSATTTTSGRRSTGPSARPEPELGGRHRRRPVALLAAARLPQRGARRGSRRCSARTGRSTPRTRGAPARGARRGRLLAGRPGGRHAPVRGGPRAVARDRRPARDRQRPLQRRLFRCGHRRLRGQPSSPRPTRRTRPSRERRSQIFRGPRGPGRRGERPVGHRRRSATSPTSPSRPSRGSGRPSSSSRRSSQKTMEAWALHMLGTTVLKLGRTDEAAGIMRHALRDFEPPGTSRASPSCSTTCRPSAS